MSENPSAPPKIGKSDWPNKQVQKSDKPWFGWAGLWFGAGSVVTGFSRLVTATTSYQVELILNAIGGSMLLVAFFLACAGLRCSFSKRGRRNEDTLPYGAITALLIMAGSALTLVAAAVLATEESLETAVKNEIEALGWQQHSFADGKFSVNTPAAWQPVTPQRIVADLYLVDHSADLHLTCAVLPKTDVAVTGLALVALPASFGLNCCRNRRRFLQR